MNFLKKLFSKAPELLPGESEDGCENCYWKTIGRYQKCASCRRYPKLKDHYVFYAEDDTDDA